MQGFIWIICRLCLLPKALAVSQLFEVDTCLVVDSGATSTSVWVVVDGKVDESRTQTMNVGGWHVSQFLKQALTWRDNKDAAGVIFRANSQRLQIRISISKLLRRACVPLAGDCVQFGYIGGQIKVQAVFESCQRGRRKVLRGINCGGCVFRSWREKLFRQGRNLAHPISKGKSPTVRGH